MASTTSGGSSVSLGRRIVDAIGIACVVATLALVSWVRVAAADPSPDAALMTVDPVLTSPAPAAPAPARIEGPSLPPAKVPVVADEDREKVGLPAVEVRPGVIVLNTRGYNYGPPVAELDAAALRFERQEKPAER